MRAAGRLVGQGEARHGSVGPSEDHTPERSAIASIIGTLNEGHLHATLRSRYVEPGDEIEVGVDGYVVDILRGEQIIEIQTKNFSKIARKMRALVGAGHRVRLVLPIPRDVWIVKVSENGSELSRRRSPKHPEIVDVFGELVSIPELIGHERFELEVVLTREERVVRQDARAGWRRRGWLTIERRLLEVCETVPLRTVADYVALLPAGLGAEFGTAEIAAACGRPRAVGQQIAYCLRRCGVIEKVGSVGNAVVYARVTAGPLVVGAPQVRRKRKKTSVAR